MNFLESFLEGIITAVGMFIMMTVLGMLSWFALKKWIIKNITETWTKVKEEGIRLDGLRVEGKVISTKKRKNK